MYVGTAACSGVCVHLCVSEHELDGYAAGVLKSVVREMNMQISEL